MERSRGDFRERGEERGRGARGGGGGGWRGEGAGEVMFAHEGEGILGTVPAELPFQSAVRGRWERGAGDL